MCKPEKNILVAAQRIDEFTIDFGDGVQEIQNQIIADEQRCRGRSEVGNVAPEAGVPSSIVAKGGFIVSQVPGEQTLFRGFLFQGKRFGRGQ